MSARIIFFAVLLLAYFVYESRSAEPADSTLPPAEISATTQEKDKGKAKSPDKEKKLPEKQADPAPADIFAADPSAGGELSLGFHPHMIGDFPGSFARQTITIFGTQTTTTTTAVQQQGKPPKPPRIITTTVTTPVTQTRTILVPSSTLGAFKIAENASPRPVDRVFFTYNFFGDLHGPNSGPTGPVNVITTTGNPGAGNGRTSVITFPGTPQVSANVNREVFGFEKTFLNGFASIEVRLPLLQQNSTLDGFSSHSIGNLTIIGKYAFILDQQTGNVLSAGLAITAPTGRSIDSIDGNIHSTLIQPWFGYIWNRDRFFLHAFHSVVAPTDARDVTLLFNDVGLNYWLYRSNSAQRLRFIVPMVEAHVTTPMNHRSGDGPIYVPDLVVMTGGAHFGLGRNTTLTLGAGSPVSGPRIFNVEGFLQLNMRY